MTLQELVNRIVDQLLNLRWRSALKTQEFVFILAHMRSGSSLLMHLLLAHPDFLGHGERNRAYQSEEDFLRLMVESRAARHRWLGDARYFADQINHSKFTPDPEVLSRPGLFRVFLIRKPEATLTSIVRTFQPIYGGWPVERAADYYCERLAALGRLAASTERGCYLKYEELVEETRNCLDRLAQFLALESPLQERYPTYSFTGKAGDPSKTIHEGRVVRTSPRLPLEIPRHLLDECRDSYDRCLAIFRQRLQGSDH